VYLAHDRCQYAGCASLVEDGLAPYLQRGSKKGSPPKKLLRSVVPDRLLSAEWPVGRAYTWRRSCMPEGRERQHDRFGLTGGRGLAERLSSAPSGLRQLMESDDMYEKPCFPEVMTTFAMLTKTAVASDRRSRWRQTCATMGPSSLLGRRGATNRIAVRWYSPGAGLPSEAVARIEVPGIGHLGLNADPAAGGPNAANQGVYAAKGPFSMQLIRRRTQKKVLAFRLHLL